MAETSNSSQNRKTWPNLARIREHYQLSDRAAAAVANGVLIDVGFVTQGDKTCIIDRTKLQREREMRKGNPGRRAAKFQFGKRCALGRTQRFNSNC